MSIAIVKPPVVAAGAGMIQGDKLLVGGSLVGVLVLAIVSAWIRRREARSS